MSVGTLFLFFLACGAATFPLSLVALRGAAALSPNGRWAQKVRDSFEAAFSLALVVWIVGALVFYVTALHIERKKPCEDQHTNQLTPNCKKVLGAIR
jgi:thiol:disulfide interchange protein